MKRAIAVLNASAFMAAAAWGQDAGSATKLDLPEFISDRPGYTETTAVVGRGIAQIELGMLIERGGRDQEHYRAISAPQSLLRLGLSSRIELRLSEDGYQSQLTTATREKVRGASDAAIGAKVKLINERGWRPAVAVIGTVTAPVGQPNVSSGGWDPEVKFSFAKDEGLKGFSLGGNLNLAAPSDADGHLLTKAASVTVSRDLPAGLNGYFEWYAIGPGRGLGRTMAVNGGITRMLSRNTQFDVEVGHTVSGRTPSWFISFGFVGRLPLRSVFR